MNFFSDKSRGQSATIICGCTEKSYSAFVYDCGSFKENQEVWPQWRKCITAEGSFEVSFAQVSLRGTFSWHPVAYKLQHSHIQLHVCLHMLPFMMTMNETFEIIPYHAQLNVFLIGGVMVMVPFHSNKKPTEDILQNQHKFHQVQFPDTS